MKIKLIEPIASGAPFVAPVLVSRLGALPNDPAGSHVLGALGAAMSIAIAIGATTGSPPDGAEIHMRALEAPGAFPVFHGTLRVEPVDTFCSRLVLAGTYNVPLGMIGGVADRTLLAGTAKRSLRALLRDMREAIAAAVTQDAGASALGRT
jgi:hypothetical protein